MHMMLPLLAIMHIAAHISIASLMSGISGNTHSTVTIAGIRTDLGTVLVFGFAGFMVLMCFFFSEGSKGERHRNSGLGWITFIVFIGVFYAIGLMAH